MLRPRGLVDLRGPGDVPALLSYPPGAVVVVSGLPGSGKSTLLRRWSEAASVVDPRTVHLACEAVMPARLPYAVYRPWARWKYFRWLRTAVRGGEALLVHDCGGRPWMRRWLARSAGRQGRELHLVLLDVGVAEALSGQQARGRWAPRRAFVRHRRGLDRLLGVLLGLGAPQLPAPRAAADEADDASPPHATRRPKQSAPPANPAADPVPEAHSVVLLDRGSREQVAAVEFVPAPARSPLTEDGGQDSRRASRPSSVPFPRGSRAGAGLRVARGARHPCVMSYVRLEAWIGGEWLEVDAVSVTVMDSALTLSFEPQRSETAYRSLIWEPLENFLREYRDEPVVVVPLGRNLPVMFGPGAAGPFRLAETSGK